MILDAAVNAAYKAIIQTGTSVVPFKYAALAGGNGSTALSSALSTSSPISSLPVTGLLVGSSIANGQPLLLQSGTNIQVVYATASAPAGSISVSVASVPGGSSFTPNFAYPIGTFVIPQPQASDNPSALVGALYITIPGGNIVFNDGAAAGSSMYSGYGNRKLALTPLTWTNSTATPYTFTEIWLCTNNPVNAVGQCGMHFCVAQTTIAASGGTFAPVITEKY